MSRKLLVLLLMGIVGANLVEAGSKTVLPKQKASYDGIPVFGGSNEPQINIQSVPWRPSRHTLDDPIGITDTAGTTWYDYQHNGTCGKMIDVDDMGMVSVVWMKGFYENPLLTRLVYYNVWDPAAGNFMFEGGIRIDPADRSGYVTQTTDALGFCYPAFHRLASTGNNHTAVGGDYAAYSDAFTSWEPDWCYEGPADLKIIWPKIAMDIHGNLHVISTENPADENAVRQRIYYSHGIPEFDELHFFLDILWDEMECGGFELMDTVTTISPDIACSRHSERVVIAYTRPMLRPEQYPEAPGWHQRFNEVYICISEDGGLNWEEPVNITRWTPPDPVCYYETQDALLCDRDTLRAYTDCAVILDDEDFIHVAFTTTGFWWYLPGETDSVAVTYSASLIWHWNEEWDAFSLAAEAWYEADPPSVCGAWQYRAQRPNLAIDPTTGYLYCSYMLYDTLFSEGGFPLSDAFVTVSTDNGCNWAVATNVTSTMPEVIPTPAGDCLNERDITVAEFVTGGFLHMEYVLDKDAGSVVYSEGVATLNPVIFQRIPIDSIPTQPLLPNYPMHWDSTGFPGNPGVCRDNARVLRDGHPDQFLLYPNYPNPFNPATMLQFDLLQRARVTLKVYNVLGQEVVTLIGNELMSAGVHTVRFDGASYPSGVYVYRLETPGFSAVRKMVLLK